MDPEQAAFLESQKEYDPMTDYSLAQQAPPDDGGDDEEEEYDPMTALPSHPAETAPSPSDKSMSMQPESAVNTPPPAPADGLKPQSQAAAVPTPSKQPRTMGGFVVESDDEDEVPEPQPQAEGSALLNANGASHSPQRDSHTRSPSNTLAPTNVPVHSAQDLAHSGVAPSSSVAVNDAAPVQPPTPSAQGTPVPDSTKTAGQGPLNAASARPSSTLATPVTAAPSQQRLPQDRVGILEDRIAEDPRGDIEAWLSLIQELRRRHKIDEVRALYDRFFKVFPTASEQWNDLALMELEFEEVKRAEKVFERSLTTNFHVGLWSTYINYVRRHNNIDTAPDTARPIITQVYEFVLEHMGIDFNSGRIWMDYIEFLKSSLPGMLGGTDWRDLQKMDTLRKVYQRAIAVPTNATMDIWREYNNFELHMNKATGRKHLQEQSPFYMTARSAKNVLDNITKGVNRTTLPSLPPLQGFQGYEEYTTQVKLWKAWIEWEKDDPLVVKEDKPEVYHKRVLYLYKQALMALRFWPELWYDAAEWCYQNDLVKEGDDFLTQGIDANPESCLLAFRKGHQIELKGDFEEGEAGAVRKGDAVRAPYDRVLDELYQLTDKMKKREEQSIARTKESFAAQQAAEEAARASAYRGSDDDDTDEEAENARRQREKEEALKSQIQSISAGYNAQITTLKKTISYAWIALMRAMRRIQGKGRPDPPAGSGPGFRGIFSEARKRGKLLSDAYVASALIEHYCYQDPAATKIFDRGMKLFPNDEHFALEYIKHLVKQNDLTNARSVFETVVNRITQKEEGKPRVKPLFSFFHEYESQFGDLAQIVKLEKRMNEFYPEDPQLARFAERYSTPTFDPTAVRPVISMKAQMKPALLNIMPTVEEPQAPPSQPIQESRLSPVQSPRIPAAMPMPLSTNSPKRPFEDVDNELAQPRKIVRGESPLKGAAGRRLDAARRNLARASEGTNQQAGAPVPAKLPGELNFLLSVIPGRKYYHADRDLNPQRLVALFRATHIPSSLPQQPPQQQTHVAPVMQHPPMNQAPPMNYWAPQPPSGMGGYYGGR